MTIRGYGFVGEAKWREIQFIYMASQMSGARKTAVKKFVNTGSQLVEDLGEDQRSYNVTGLISPLRSDEIDGSVPNQSIHDVQYISKRDTFIKALETEGPGTLVHPLYGVIQNLVVTSYSLEETITEIGIGKLNIDFEVSNATGAPTTSITNVSNIAADNRKVINAAIISIEENFEATPALLGVYASAKNKVTEISDKIASALKFPEKLTQDIEKVSNMIADFQDGVIAFTSSAEDLASAIGNVFDTINASIASAEAKYEIAREFFNFGYVTNKILSLVTKANTKKDTNNRTLNNAMNAMSLTNAYLAVANKDYKTVTEIDADITVLEEQIFNILSAPEFDSDTLVELLNARENINTFLDELKLTVSKIIEVDTTLTSARAISFLYYGDDSEGESIAKLNGSNGLFLSGNIEIFSA